MFNCAGLYALETADEIFVEDILQQDGVYIGQGEPRAGSFFACAVRDKEGRLQLIVAVDSVLKRWQPAGTAPEPLTEKAKGVLRAAARALSMAFQTAAAASADLSANFDTDIASLMQAASEADRIRHEETSASGRKGLDPLEASRLSAIARIRSALFVFRAMAPTVVRELQLMLEPPQDVRTFRARCLDPVPLRPIRQRRWRFLIDRSRALIFALFSDPSILLFPLYFFRRPRASSEQCRGSRDSPHGTCKSCRRRCAATGRPRWWSGWRTF